MTEGRSVNKGKTVGMGGRYKPWRRYARSRVEDRAGKSTCREGYSTKQLVLQEEQQGRIDFRAEDSVEGNVRSRAGQRTQQHRAE